MDRQGGHHGCIWHAIITPPARWHHDLACILGIYVADEAELLSIGLLLVWQTPKAIWKRIQNDGAAALKEILPKTKLWNPGKASQVKPCRCDNEISALKLGCHFLGCCITLVLLDTVSNACSDTACMHASQDAVWPVIINTLQITIDAWVVCHSEL